ncbi:MAG: hypothetical protein WD266_01275 [Balneolales bacterium]
MRFLIYGFKPYAGYKSNVSSEVMTSGIIRHEPVMHIFDVCFDYRMFATVLQQVEPDVILGLGQHPRARKLRLERKARNLMKVPGREITPVSIDGPPTIYTNLDLPQTTLTTRSYDAGSYVCNYSMYLAGEYCRGSSKRFGFIHIPKGYECSLAGEYINHAIAEILSE